MSNAFPEINGLFGFGCMRLPMKNNEIDYAEFSAMVDLFMDCGFNYFDTAHIYHSGKSEIAMRECLVKRYPRERFIFTNKLTQNYFNSESEIRPLFESQLDACGLKYFDFYLMHAMTEEYYAKYKKCRCFEIASELKKEGKIHHLGISFHDKAALLDKILTEHPEVEVVQIQFNYADFDSPIIESKKCYDVCLKHNKPVIVMEPLKGGALADLPPECGAVLSGLNNESSAGYALRFCASFPQVTMILSGMSNTAVMEKNLATMKNVSPLTEAEHKAAGEIRNMLKNQDTVACTSCRYCVDGCPQRIQIPDLISCFNAKKQFNDLNSNFYYGVYTANNGKASDCIACGECERTCPQHLPIIEVLKETASLFEK